jgi:cobalt/nickel transport system permease protein
MTVPSVPKLELSPAYFLFALGGLLLLWGLARFWVSHTSRKNPEETGREKDWSIPSLDTHASRNSPFHRWDPRIKICSLFWFIFCLASVRELVWAGMALCLALGSVRVAGIPFRYPLKRLLAMGAFLGMILLVMPLTAPTNPGDTQVVFTHLEFIPFNMRGFFRAVLVCLKACSIAILVEPLLATSPFSTTVQALHRLRVPSIVCQMVLLCHRYVYVFQHEASRMGKGMNARGFQKRTDMETLRSVGNFLGMLLVRSFERTQRVYEAMLSRGYDGTLPDTADFKTSGADWAKGAFWFLAGVVILVADRFLGFWELKSLWPG